MADRYCDYPHECELLVYRNQKPHCLYYNEALAINTFDNIRRPGFCDHYCKAMPNDYEFQPVRR